MSREGEGLLNKIPPYSSSSKLTSLVSTDPVSTDRRFFLSSMKKKSNPLRILLKLNRAKPASRDATIDELRAPHHFLRPSMPPLVFNQSSIRAHRRTLPCGRAAHLIIPRAFSARQTTGQPLYRDVFPSIPNTRSEAASSPRPPAQACSLSFQLSWCRKPLSQGRSQW